MNAPHTLDLSRLETLRKASEQVTASCRDINARVRAKSENIEVIRGQLHQLAARKVDFDGAKKQEADLATKLSLAERELVDIRAEYEAVSERRTVVSALYRRCKSFAEGLGR